MSVYKYIHIYIYTLICISVHLHTTFRSSAPPLLLPRSDKLGLATNTQQWFKHSLFYNACGCKGGGGLFFLK